MKLIGLTGVVYLWLCTTMSWAQNNHDNHEWNFLRSPTRVFSKTSQVDLHPLFDWWTRQPLVITNEVDTNNPPDSDRPLTGWQRVTGRKLGVAGGGWIVSAVIFNSPTERTNTRILLYHPPAAEEQAYYNLREQLAETGAQLEMLQQSYRATTNAEFRAVRLVEEYKRSVSKVAPTGIVQYSKIAMEKHQAAVEQQAQMDQLQKMRAEYAKQLKAIPQENGDYTVDWFAAQVGHTKKGLPIYDLGLIGGTYP